jgi:tryptophan-rich sensory protein
MLYINSIRDNLISASPFLVSLPFTATNVGKFDVNEEKALWQPPGYVFGIVWPTLYILLFIMNKQIYTSKSLSDSFKNKVRMDTLIESFLQGSWLYVFRFNPDIGGRSKNQKLMSLGLLGSMLGFGVYRIFGFVKHFKSFFGAKDVLKYYIPYFAWLNLATVLGFQLYFDIIKKKN